MKHLQLVLIILISTKSDCAHILIAISSPYSDHQTIFHELWKSLLKNNHEITLLTTHAISDHNLTNLEEIIWHQEVNKDTVDQNSAFINYYYNFMLKTVDSELSHPQVKKLLAENRKFDLVITEYYVPVLYALAHVYNCPLILVTINDMSAFMYASLGNPAHPAYNPDLILPYKHPLNFVERFISTGVLCATKIYYELFVNSRETALVHKHFGPNFPSAKELSERISLVFVNKNPILGHIRPLLPTIVLIGGSLHIRSPKPLPEYIDQFLEDSPNGVIYVNLELITPKSLLAIKRSLEELQFRAIVKCDKFGSSSDKILVSDWFPQQDILRHHNTKLFVTHGGERSVEEAIYYKVPMILLPMNRDQYAITNQLVARGVALSLEYPNITKRSLNGLLCKFWKKQSYRYRNSMQHLHELIHDQPFTGMEKAIWWTDYVIRHKGTTHLNHPHANIPWYQYFLLDVIGFLLAVFMLILMSIFACIKLLIYLVKRCCFKKKAKVE